MPLSRRSLVLAGTLSPLALKARAADDPRLGLRDAGNPSAPTQVQEWFSLTCTHCARFAIEVFPDVKAKLIDAGRVHYVFHDYPLDRVALLAAMVSRALPPERYLPFIDALFASQDRWAFAQGVDSRAELGRMAALAGMPSATFDAVTSDAAYQRAIIAKQDEGTRLYHIDSTPTFVFGQTPHPGELSYEGFAALASKAA